MPELSVCAVSKSFGMVHALSGVDLEVRAHEVVAVVGENGAGKSTLAGVIAGAFQPDSGQVLRNGTPVTFASPAAARDAGVAAVFQDLALCDNLDVVENLFLAQESTIGPFLDEPAMERQAWQLLDQLGASVPSVRLPLHALSGGQRRTVAVARALLGSPRVVILDEPTASLGARQAAEVLNLIERLRDGGQAVVFVCHSTAEAQAVADRIVVLRLGRINGEYDAERVSYEDLLGAMTGATGLDRTRTVPGGIHREVRR